MSNVASLELSKKLYELSGWNDAPFAYDTSYADNWLRYIEDFPGDTRERRGVDIIPAYDLGYLLRKMPRVDKDGIFAWVTVSNGTNDWTAYWESDQGLYASRSGDTPEDVACKLAIELFNQGILTRGDKV